MLCRCCTTTLTSLACTSTPQGEEAAQALNVFHHLTYEGGVNIDDITDPLQRAATISTIDNFGQTPRQLFRKPHPQRRVCTGVTARLLCATNMLSRLVVSAHPVLQTTLPIASVRLLYID